MITLNPIRRAREAARQQGIDEAVAFLYAQADLHRGEPCDQKRRGALHHAADRLRDGRGVGRPPVLLMVVDEPEEMTDCA